MKILSSWSTLRTCNRIFNITPKRINKWCWLNITNPITCRHQLKCVSLLQITMNCLPLINRVELVKVTIPTTLLENFHNVFWCWFSEDWCYFILHENIKICCFSLFIQLWFDGGDAILKSFHSLLKRLKLILKIDDSGAHNLIRVVLVSSVGCVPSDVQTMPHENQWAQPLQCQSNKWHKAPPEAPRTPYNRWNQKRQGVLLLTK